MLLPSEAQFRVDRYSVHANLHTALNFATLHLARLSQLFELCECRCRKWQVALLVNRLKGPSHAGFRTIQTETSRGRERRFHLSSDGRMPLARPLQISPAESLAEPHLC